MSTNKAESSQREWTKGKKPRFGLCRIGIHFPVSVDQTLFVDHINGHEVYEGRCGCGRKWMHQSVVGLPWFKVEVNRGDDA